MDGSAAGGGRQIHWFPGHMAQTLRRIKQQLHAVDAVVQLLDARVPHTSLNADLQAQYGQKPRLYVLNKSDLADAAATAEWLRHFEGGENSACAAVDSRRKGAAAEVRAAVDAALGELFEKRRLRGISGAAIRLMITGIPNVGKSTFINSWAGGARARAADKPGVTRGEQWISAGKYELLDMPGVLCKKLSSPAAAVNLALIGSMPDSILDVEELAAGLLRQLAARGSTCMEQRFGIGVSSGPSDGWALLEAVAARRGMLMSGGAADTGRAAVTVLDEFRAGKLGRVTLELPADTGAQSGLGR